MPGGFGNGPCRFCEKLVTSCGYGEWNHLRMHYRQVFCKEPPRYYGVLDLSVAISRWRREAIAAAQQCDVHSYNLDNMPVVCEKCGLALAIAGLTG